MEIIRQQEFVEAFHYDARTGEEEAETEIRVEIKPIDMSEQAEFPHDTSSVLGLRIIYQIVFEDFALTGAVRQLVTLTDRKIEKHEELSSEEIELLVDPLFSIVKRMTYEVTEIALDKPGVELNFGKSSSEE